MNHETDDTPCFDDPVREREWLAQENAMRHERLRLNPAGDDARAQRYRLLARALRAEPPDTLPADFAQQVSALTAVQARGRAPAMTFERVLTTALAGVFLLAAAIVIVIYGATWWPSFEALQPAPATTQWLLALVGCLGLSWLLPPTLLGAWSRLARPGA